MVGLVKKLIINADDFGLSPGINRGIREAAEAGAISSISVMTNFSYVSDLIAFHKEFPAITIGVHLNPIVGCPVLSCRSVPTLVNSEGLFWNKEFSARLQRSMIQLSELENEMVAQVTVLQDMGIKISHLDSHQNEHLRPGYFEIFLRIAGKFGIKRMRNHRYFICVECDRPLSRTIRFYLTHPYSLLLHGYTRYLMWRAQRKGMLMADRLIYVGHSTGADLNEKWVWEGILKNLPDGINELYCHPGFSDDVLRKCDSYVDGRDQEREILCSSYFKELLLKNNIELVDFNCLQQDHSLLAPAG